MARSNTKITTPKKASGKTPFPKLPPPAMRALSGAGKLSEQVGKVEQLNEIDRYFAKFPANVQLVLNTIRENIRAAAPDASEIISYQMPAFKQHGILVYFAAWQKHIGFYPPISGDAAIEQAVVKYAGPKGNLQFPLNEPIPYALIKRIVKLRVKQDKEKHEAKRTNRKKK